MLRSRFQSTGDFLYWEELSCSERKAGNQPGLLVIFPSGSRGFLLINFTAPDSLVSTKSWNNQFSFLHPAIECEELPQPSNGQLLCDTAERSIGTVCNMACNEGYELKGSLQTQCELNDAEDGGQWSNTNGRCNGMCSFRNILRDQGPISESCL